MCSQMQTHSSNLGRDSSLRVRNLDPEFLCARDDFDSLSRRDGVGDPVVLLADVCGGEGGGAVLGGEGLVVHEEEVDIAGVVDEEGFVAGGHHVSGLSVGSESDLEVFSGAHPSRAISGVAGSYIRWA